MSPPAKLPAPASPRCEREFRPGCVLHLRRWRLRPRPRPARRRGAHNRPARRMTELMSTTRPSRRPARRRPGQSIASVGRAAARHGQGQQRRTARGRHPCSLHFRFHLMAPARGPIRGNLAITPGRDLLRCRQRRSAPEANSGRRRQFRQSGRDYFEGPEPVKRSCRARLFVTCVTLTPTSRIDIIGRRRSGPQNIYGNPCAPAGRPSIRRLRMRPQCQRPVAHDWPPRPDRAPS